MKVDPCNVCGNTEVNLVDGYYYCIECGTQDVNVRETIVEQKSLADGTFATSTRKRVVTAADKGIEMSSEWCTWHTFNFILEGLAEELVNLGADPSFKTKLLWIWTRYIKMYQNKEKLGLSKDSDKSLTLQSLIEAEDTTKPSEEDEYTVKKKKRIDKKSENFRRDINFLSKGVVLSMLYLALNFDKSHIQLSHLYRFIKEGRISFLNINRYVPQEIDLKMVRHWTGFIQGTLCGPHTVRATSMTLLKKLDLGAPIVPEYKILVKDFMQELCLPVENLVFSLMQFLSLDNLDISSRNTVGTIRVPDYEAAAMSYVLVALKMCFGLDDDYEIKLSDAVEKINAKNGWERSYRIGIPELTNRLFSFREWCYYLRARKIMLRKHCLYMAEENFLDLDDHVFMEHMVERTKGKVELMDEIAMDLLNRIPLESVRVIPKEEFRPCFTPISTYTQVILDHCQDPELRLLLSEDFTQYSLKYACEDLELKDLDTSENIVFGVNKSNKVNNDTIEGVLETKKSDVSMVYVKNCENKNWLKTNPPSMEHVTKVDAELADKEKNKDSDHGYDSNADISNDSGNKTEKQERIPMIKEEDVNKNIFDDNFEDLDLATQKRTINDDEIIGNLIFEDNNIPYNLRDNDENSRQSSDEHNANDWNGSLQFNPDTFDRENTKKELILTACKKYKIPIPREYRPKGTVKRKTKTTINDAETTTVKRRKVGKPGDAQKEVDKLITAYYAHMERDVLKNISEQVRTAIQNWDKSQVNVENDVDLMVDTVHDNNVTLNESNQNDISEISRIEGVVNNIDLDRDSLEKTDAINDNLESKLFEDDGTDNEIDAECKCDPKFDDKKYDIDQLYIKIKEDTEDCFEVKDDPVIEEILSRKIEECKKSTKFLKLQPQPKVADSSDSEDDLPLKVLQQEKLYMEQKFADRELDPLVRDVVKKHRYWLRHYTSARMTKSLDMHEKFELELEKNCPKSFHFVIRECASVLNCSTFYLYKNMQGLERSLIARAKYL